jgi:chromosome segregation ATPase
MAEAIKFIKQEIKAKEARIRVLTERLEKLQSQPNPDPDQIQEIKADIQELEDQLETTARPQLNAFEEEFAASCG